MDYQEFISRNSGYIPSDLQEKLKTARVMIAGCGVGSGVATALTRLGVQNFSLVDGDTVGTTNLNRQFFYADDVGKYKPEALAKHMWAINPDCQIDVNNIFLSPENVDSLFENPFDLVIDSIDFVDITAIYTLHRNALARKIPVISMLNIGYGAGAMFFSPHNDTTFLQVLGMNPDAEITNEKYITSYAQLVDRLEEFLGTQVMAAAREAFRKMMEGTPCPVSQIAAGAFSCGTLACYLIGEYLSGRALPEAPQFMYLDLKQGLRVQDVS
jgi:molybdopterin/thiamine biosynthesis adenylyltransferase